MPGREDTRCGLSQEKAMLRLRTMALVVAVAAFVGACGGHPDPTASSNANPYDYRTEPSTTTSYVGRSVDPKVYSGPRSNVMDCGRLTLAQRQFFPLYRYGCEDLPTPSDAE
jgi:hypothetical protein